MDHRVNRRVDDLLAILLTIEEDIFHDRMRKEVWCNYFPQSITALALQVMHDSHDSSLKSEGNNRHKRGQDIPDVDVKVNVTSHSYTNG